jgi:hypothetical protein
MIEKSPLCPERVRKITGSFAFLEHRFLRDDFWTSLPHSEQLLYIFLILVADRPGLSYYSFDKICTLLQMSLDDYLVARNALITKDLLAFDGPPLPGALSAIHPRAPACHTSPQRTAYGPS